MITRRELEDAQGQARQYLAMARITLRPDEESRIEVVDFGLGALAITGLELLTYFNTERVCAKELVLFPNQTCPEHRHPPVSGSEGKEETFRCRYGTVYLYVEGPPAPNPKALPPKGCESHYLSKHEVVLRPGEQYTLRPDTWHWFQSGPEGAVVSEFSTRSCDDSDIFADPRIQRRTLVNEG